MKTLFSLPIVLVGLLTSPFLAVAEDSVKFSGLLKFQATQNGYDNNSILTHYGVSPQEQYNIDARLMIQQQHRNLDWAMHYQIVMQKSNIPLNLTNSNVSVTDTDQYRLWDLSREISKSERIENLQRLDRLYLRYSSDQWVIKAGRQAISWGHGQFFNPLDIANPFDPVLIDKEYKIGDDMLYLQWVQENGNDVQTALIPRRDNDGQLQSSQSTFAVKYRGLWQNVDYDILLAHHYGEKVFGIGANIPWHDSNINSDWLYSQIHDDPGRSWVITGNIGISYSWTWWNKNVIGRGEFFHNGLGLSNPPLGSAQITNNTALNERLLRGELYTLAKNYLAGGLNIELHPLFLLDINAFINLHDPSATLQILGLYNQSDKTNISTGLIIPLGADGSEFGGIDSGVDGYISRQYSLFAKYTYYL